MDIMAGVGTVVLVASIVAFVLVSVLLLIVSVWPNFLNNWKSPAATGPSIHEAAEQDSQTALRDK